MNQNNFPKRKNTNQDWLLSLQTNKLKNECPDKLAELSPVDIKALLNVGIMIDNGNRAGTFILRNYQYRVNPIPVDGLEVLPINSALKKYDWLREKYYSKLIKPDQDEVTAFCAEQEIPSGYFIHVSKGVKIANAFQAGFCIASSQMVQAVHNVVILEEDAELHLITGCTVEADVGSGAHFAISEHFVEKNASFTNTMVHSWGESISVRSRAGTIVDDDSVFTSNYICMRPARDMESNPMTWLNGKNASAKYQTVIFGSQGSDIQTGGEIYLNGENSSAELAHRAVCTGGKINQEGLLIGNAKNCHAHVDCAGMLLDPGDEGYIISVPGLKALHPEARMSHEASIGKIAPEQVEYLMCRGMDESEAISMIVRGFFDADFEHLGPELDARIAEIAELAGHGEDR